MYKAVPNPSLKTDLQSLPKKNMELPWESLILNPLTANKKN